MAVIDPVRSQLMNAEVITWSGISSDTSDTMTAAGLASQAGLAAAVQATGTFGGASVGLEGSNDGVNFVALKDIAGNNISFDDIAGIEEFSTAVAFIRPSYFGGTAMVVDVTVVTRG